MVVFVLLFSVIVCVIVRARCYCSCSCSLSLLLFLFCVISVGRCSRYYYRSYSLLFVVRVVLVRVFVLASVLVFCSCYLFVFFVRALVLCSASLFVVLDVVICCCS